MGDNMPDGTHRASEKSAPDGQIEERDSAADAGSESPEEGAAAMTAADDALTTPDSD
ncbi:hypothetical protein [Microbacterium deminutum]|uniref:Uncharacterized protein n=1 Tax=Microbacterium deminutum TaxID=344164 RepID=A0ABN2R294_9MICO